MVDIVADLHLHSKYSRAVSPQMTPPVMAEVGKKKGIDLLATGDWTHPVWLREIRQYLGDAEEGLYKIKNPQKGQEATRFLLSVEIATIFTQGGKGRRIHNLVFVPSFEVAEKVNKELLKRGFNLSSDGRPILGLSSKNLLQLILDIDERSLLIPAHAWTPWFGIYGQMSGFQSLPEAFEDLAPYVYGIETGLSSDPEMNWQMKELETRSILSFSDAHSPAKMGREATVFRLSELSYSAIREAIMQPSQHNVIASKAKQSQEIATSPAAPRNDVVNKVLYTVEFYPEEGKYHYSGHRNCNVSMTPEEQLAAHGICPMCHRKVTDGVMRRVQELAGEFKVESSELRIKKKTNEMGLEWITDATGKHPPFVRIVPLLEIIAEAIGSPVGSVKVSAIFESLTEKFGSELDILLKIPKENIKQASIPAAMKIAEGIEKVRGENIVIKPGYDGVYGVVKIWNEDKDKGLMINDKEEKTVEKQLGLDL